LIKVLAFDYGASSGRSILGKFDGNKLSISEIHRFDNNPILINNSIYWDILRLFYEMKEGIRKCINSGNTDISGIGVVTWGVDFGLLDKNGDLLCNPYHYRDNRTESMIEKASSYISKEEIYNTTGIAFQKFNTLYQFLSMKERDHPVYDKIQTLLFIPDLLNYFFTGIKSSEYTIASTSQMLNIKTNNWAKEMLKKMNLSLDVLTDIINPGTIYGKIKKDIANELNTECIPVIAVCEHDTGSAVVAVPTMSKNYAYISSGTWSLLGVESVVPIINNKSYIFGHFKSQLINNSRMFHRITLEVGGEQL
jgi:sugar (pentulose or hexulose) kinase